MVSATAFRFPRKTAILVLIFVLAWSTVLLQVPAVYSQDFNQEKALYFLKNVACLDMTKYEAKLDFCLENQGAGFADAVGSYDLIAGNSTLRVLFNFRNNSIVLCKNYPRTGNTPVFFSQTPQDTKTSILDWLDRFENLSDATYLQPMRSMLSSVAELSSTTIVQGDLRLEIQSGANGNAEVVLMKNVNGIKNDYSEFIIELRNGSFKSFTDCWDRYQVGSADVKVSKEQAINIGVARAAGFSYNMGYPGQSMVVSGLTVMPNVTLYPRLTMELRGGLLYPLWEMYVPLDHVYPGNVYAVHVMMWADTGEVSVIEASSTLGDTTPVDEEPTPTPSASPSPQQTATPPATTTTQPTTLPSPTPSPSPTLNPTPEPTQTASPTIDSDDSSKSNTLPIIAGIIIVIILAGAGALVYFKTRKKQK
jgi:hypothetical protein